MKLISEVLHDAADKYLAPNREVYWYNTHMEQFSCCTIVWAAGNDELEERTLKGLEEMGCPTGSATAFIRLGYKDAIDEETQGVRYMWLKFAALMAEEQGV